MDEAVRVEMRRVVRHLHRYSVDERTTLATAAQSVGYRRRQAMGEYFYSHPDVPGIAYRRRSDAAIAAIKRRGEVPP